jgi:hypothetical protein
MGGYFERARGKEWDQQDPRLESEQETIEAKGSGCAEHQRWKKVTETIDVCETSTTAAARQAVRTSACVYGRWISYYANIVK